MDSSQDLLPPKEPPMPPSTIGLYTSKISAPSSHPRPIKATSEQLSFPILPAVQE